MVKVSKKHLIILAAAAILCLLCGFLVGKGMYDRPLDESVSRDTVTLHDTVPEYLPAPKDSVRTKYVTRWLPRDTSSRVDHFREFTQMVEHLADTSKMIAVEVPITSKHYGSKDYDAWVSGYEPSLDSINVYKETQFITETITRTVKDNKHFFLDVGAGCEYQFNGKTTVPFAELGARLKFGRVGIGAYGGYSHDLKENKASPQARIKVSYDILGF